MEVLNINRGGGRMYTELILDIVPYYQHLLKRIGFTGLMKLTDSGYPKFMALGWCLHDHSEIVVCKIGNVRLRLWHERGHMLGFKHVSTYGHIMHPWGICRGTKGLDEIVCAYGKEE